MKNMAIVIVASIVVMLLAKSLLAKPDEAEKAKAREKIRQGALVVDVRTSAEFATGHHAAATNLPVQEIQSRLAELGDKGRAIVVYCRSGNRSSTAKQILEAAGFTDVTNGGSLGDVTETR